ncbi:MAG: hypothetical protein AAGK97_12890 [Bacteroidota bacterium]
MTRPEDKNSGRPFEDAEYMGNIWGWKFSFIALGVILALGLFMFIRYQQVGEPFLSTDPIEQTIDSTNQE